MEQRLRKTSSATEKDPDDITEPASQTETGTDFQCLKPTTEKSGTILVSNYCYSYLALFTFTSHRQY